MFVHLYRLLYYGCATVPGSAPGCIAERCAVTSMGTAGIGMAADVGAATGGGCPGVAAAGPPLAAAIRAKRSRARAIAS